MVLVVPATWGDGIPLTTRVVAALETTTIPVWEPVMVAVTVSVAVTDCVPAVFSVTPGVKMWMPLSSPVPLVNL